MASIERFDFGAGKRKAVTLIEVLVVVATIALLVSILIPALNKARKQAWRMECAGNLRAVGNAYNFYKTDLGRYPDIGDRKPTIFGPQWLPGDLKPQRSGLANIGGDLVEALVYTSLGDPRAFFCPASMRNDPHAPVPYEKVSGHFVETWKNGQISYFSLVGVTDSFLNAQGVATFEPTRESPDQIIGHEPMNLLNSRAVLLGDRTVELMPGKKNIAGSNHDRDGGWFYFTSGDALWRSWDSLTAHPTKNYLWYWPKMVSEPQTF